MHVLALLAGREGLTTRDIIGMVVVGIIVLAMWFGFRNLERLTHSSPPTHKDDSTTPSSEDDRTR